MIFNFKINKNYLLIHALKQNISPFKEWVDLKNYLWEKNKNSYDFLIGNPEIFLKINNEKDIKQIAQKSILLIDSAIKRKEFKRLYSETQKYKNWIEKEWLKNEDKILNFIQENSGLEIKRNKKIDVFITHPKLLNGKTIIKKNIICWGHSEDWKNYSIIYLTHELMHILTKEKINSHTMHALIELLIDNELRIFLNKKGKYFKENKQHVGHEYLFDIEKKILPKWKKYLKDKNQKNLIDLEEKIKIHDVK